MQGHLPGEGRVRLRGAVHLHSRISYDGAVAFGALCRRLRVAGYDFMVITEHNDDLDEARAASLVRACAEATRGGFLCVPGVELRCEGNLHLLSLGAAFSLPVGVPLLHAVDSVRAHGGVAVLAHPPRRLRARIPREALERCDGVEVWNGKRDPRWFVPSSERAWVRSLRKQGLAIRAFAGLDFHDVGDERGAVLEVLAADRTCEAVVAALRAGAFELAIGAMRYRSDGSTGWWSRTVSDLVERGLYPSWARMRRRGRALFLPMKQTEASLQ